MTPMQIYLFTYFLVGGVRNIKEKKIPKKKTKVPTDPTARE